MRYLIILSLVLVIAMFGAFLFVTLPEQIDVDEYILFACHANGMQMYENGELDLIEMNVDFMEECQAQFYYDIMRGTPYYDIDAFNEVPAYVLFDRTRRD
jgi:hypothetical protein